METELLNLFNHEKYLNKIVELDLSKLNCKQDDYSSSENHHAQENQLNDPSQIQRFFDEKKYIDLNQTSLQDLINKYTIPMNYLRDFTKFLFENKNFVKIQLI